MGTTTTTSVIVCPSVDPNDDQGQDGTGAPLSVPATVTTSPSKTAPSSKTTSEATTSSATQTLTPIDMPSRDDLQFVIFALESQKDGKHTSDWVGVLLPTNYSDDEVCSGDYRVITSSDFSQNDAYPDHLGSFNAPGLTGCNYTSKGDDPGDVDSKDASQPCIGFDSLHLDNIREARIQCTRSGGIKEAYWVQGWCPLKKKVSIGKWTSEYKKQESFLTTACNIIYYYI